MNASENCILFSSKIRPGDGLRNGRWYFSIFHQAKCSLKSCFFTRRCIIVFTSFCERLFTKSKHITTCVSEKPYFSKNVAGMGLRNTTFYFSNHPGNSANNTSLYCNCVFMLKYSKTLGDLARFFTTCLLVATSIGFLCKFVAFFLVFRKLIASNNLCFMW